jgi:hypothetical protein
MKGLLYIIPARIRAGFTSIDVYGDGLAIPCVAFCNEDGKRLDLPVNWLATGMWHDALVRKGSLRTSPGRRQSPIC